MNERAAALVLLVSLLAGSPSHAAQGALSRCSDAAVMEGCGTYYWPDGTRYVGGFHGGFFDGLATVTFPDGARLEIMFSERRGRGWKRHLCRPGWQEHPRSVT